MTQIAQDILSDVLLERKPWELLNCTIEDAVLTVECYGYEGSELNEIANIFLNLCKSL